jgi:hypothetical protein
MWGCCVKQNSLWLADANATLQAYPVFEICVVYNGGFPTAAPEFSLPKFSIVKPAV